MLSNHPISLEDFLSSLYGTFWFCKGQLSCRGSNLPDFATFIISTSFLLLIKFLVIGTWRGKAWDCGPSHAETVGSNAAGVMDVSC
jgi:hypothetical protein